VTEQQGGDVLPAAEGMHGGQVVRPTPAVDAASPPHHPDWYYGGGLEAGRGYKAAEELLTLPKTTYYRNKVDTLLEQYVVFVSKKTYVEI
jgi:hypothetical protein